MLGVALLLLSFGVAFRLGLLLLFSLLQLPSKPFLQEAAILHEMVHSRLVIGVGLLEHFLEMIIGLAHRRLAGLVVGRGHEVSAPSFLVLLVLFARMVRWAFDGHVIPLRVLPRDSVENRAHHLLARSVIGCDVQELFDGAGAFAAQLVHQRYAHRPRKECPDDVGIGDIWDGIELLREAPDVIAEGFSRFFPAVLEIP